MVIQTIGVFNRMLEDDPEAWSIRQFVKLEAETAYFKERGV
jgi:hypothetical protein